MRRSKKQESALMSIAVVAKHLEDANNTLGSEVIGMALEVLNDPGAYTLSDIAGELLNVEGVLDNRDDMDKLNDEVRTLRIQVTSIRGALRNVADALDNESNENEEWLHDAAYYVRALAGDDELEGQAVGKLWNKSEISPFLTDKHAKRELDVAYAGLSRILGVKYNEAVTGNKVSLKQKNSKMIHKKKQQEAAILSIQAVANHLEVANKKLGSEEIDLALDIMVNPGVNNLFDIETELGNVVDVLDKYEDMESLDIEVNTLRQRVAGIRGALRQVGDDLEYGSGEDEIGRYDAAEYIRDLVGDGETRLLDIRHLWKKSEISQYLTDEDAKHALDVAYAGISTVLGIKYTEAVAGDRVSAKQAEFYSDKLATAIDIIQGVDGEALGLDRNSLKKWNSIKKAGLIKLNAAKDSADRGVLDLDTIEDARTILFRSPQETVGAMDKAYTALTAIVRTATGESVKKPKVKPAKKTESKVKVTPVTRKPIREDEVPVIVSDDGASVEWYVIDTESGATLAGPFVTQVLAQDALAGADFDQDSTCVISAPDYADLQKTMESSGYGLFPGAYVVIREPATQGSPGGRKVDSGVVFKVKGSIVTLEGNTQYDILKYNVIRLG